MLLGTRPNTQHPQTSSKRKSTDVDELFDTEHFPPVSDNYWEDQSQYDLGLYAVRQMDVSPASVSDSPTAASSSVSEPNDIEASPRGKKLPCEEELENSLAYPFEGTNNVGAVGLDDILSLLKPETFNWADDVEDSVESEMDDLNNTPLLFVVDSIVPPNSCDPNAVSKDGFDIQPRVEEAEVQDIDILWDYTPRVLPTLHSPEITASNLTQCQFTGKLLLGVDSKAKREMTRQIDLVKNCPNIHHFNWLGNAVMERSYTSPEVSLFVIVSPPKPLFSERLMRQAVTLWQAMKFVDPILYRGDWKDLKFSGRELLKAITGQTFQFYTPAGTWQHDTPHPDIQQPIVDPSNPQFYASEKGLPLNGWLTNSILRGPVHQLPGADKFYYAIDLIVWNWDVMIGFHDIQGSFWGSALTYWPYASRVHANTDFEPADPLCPNFHALVLANYLLIVLLNIWHGMESIAVPWDGSRLAAAKDGCAVIYNAYHRKLAPLMPDVFDRLSSHLPIDDNSDKASESSSASFSRIASRRIEKFQFQFRDGMPLSRTFTEPHQEGRIRNRSDTITLLGTAYQDPVKDVPSPPLPVQDYTVENLKDRLIYVDRILRNKQRKPSPIGTRALQIYKNACVRLLDLEKEEGDLKAAKDIWRTTLKTYDKSLYNAPCLQVACSSDAQTLQDRLISLQKELFYARYADIFAELCIQPEPGFGAAEKSYWIEVYRKLQVEDNPSYQRVFSGLQGHHANPTHLAIYRAWNRIGFSRNDVVQTIHSYVTRKDRKHMNIFPLIKSGKFDDLKKQLYHDSSIIPLLIHESDWKLIRLLSRVIQSLTDLWFDRGKIDPENYQLWKYTKALSTLYRQLRGEDYSVPQKQLACDIAKKIRKRLRDLEDEEKAIEGLSITIGPLRPSGNKTAKAAMAFSVSQLHTERGRAMKMTADWNNIMNLVHAAEDTLNSTFGKYYEPTSSLAIIPELASKR
ncbi:conserved hypothetical protein [Histoplasma capsulatum H143]|uniref:Uncharacterized protein n=1 Tax=Ajellomyces capsulatus (strain H143) TaxID=544712 RepID=C6HM57_AJECH|nr:conserved hypothetical protein [Histoplasma capsulatum H143]